MQHKLPSRDVKYNYNEIEEMLKKGNSWRKIGNFYNVAHTSAYRWFHAQRKKRMHSKQAKTVIRRSDLPSYGKLAPTGFQWRVDTVDDILKWILTYTPYNWKNKNIKENITLLWDVFNTNDIERMKQLIGKPRGSGKSKISIAFYAFILANFYLPQAVIVAGTKSKNRIFNGLKRILFSPKFRTDYGDIAFMFSRHEGTIELVDELKELSGYVSDDPSLVVSTYNGMIGAHPYIMYFEDILQSEYKSETSNEYLIEEVVLSILLKMTDRIAGTFTRKGVNDLYVKLRRYGFVLNVRKAIYLISGSFPTYDDIIFKEVRAGDDIEMVPVDIKLTGEFRIIERPGWTVKSLLIQRALDPVSFEREMQNNPLAVECKYFSTSKIELVDPFTHVKLKFYTYCDPAYGKSTHSDFTAIITVGIYNRTMWLVDVLYKQGLNFNDIVFEMISQRIKWNSSYIGLQQAFAEVWLAFETGKNKNQPVKKIKNLGNKIERIDGLSVPFNQHKIKIFRNIPQLEAVTNEILSYDQKPSTGTKKDDFLDALSMAYRDLKHYIYISQMHTISF